MNYSVLLLAASLVASAALNNFEEVVRHPQKFDREQVSLVGLAHVAGDRFYLYRDVAAASRIDLSNAIFVRQKENGPSYAGFNNQWVSVTGIIAADLHGPLGFGFPCELLVQDVHLAKRNQERQWVSDIGEFRNETPRTVHLRLFDRRHSTYAEFDIGPGGTNGVGIRNGTVVVTTLSGMAVATSRLEIPPRTNDGNEPIERKFFYRITTRKVEPVSNARTGN